MGDLRRWASGLADTLRASRQTARRGTLVVTPSAQAINSTNRSLRRSHGPSPSPSPRRRPQLRRPTRRTPADFSSSCRRRTRSVPSAAPSVATAPSCRTSSTGPRRRRVARSPRRAPPQRQATRSVTPPTGRWLPARAHRTTHDAAHLRCRFAAHHVAGARCDGNEKGFRVYLLGCVAISLGVFLWGCGTMSSATSTGTSGRPGATTTKAADSRGEPARTASR